eukprot:CAMPEP_0115169834 /NCGR_PEP_ID=MMETSP0270-20121206/1475_1 /TAXON_ID=71861 /ORGANISM="Scrippsiella trochoidea, Strain CCMP3099" /LENGTH=81 /DNA_ID=CAMNT_0002582549 /DNA_START=501 /DNA_END=743 /DNA_ORIENTATION=+
MSNFLLARTEGREGTDAARSIPMFFVAPRTSDFGLHIARLALIVPELGEDGADTLPMTEAEVPAAANPSVMACQKVPSKDA